MTIFEEWKRIDVHDVVFYKDEHFEVLRKDIRTIESEDSSETRVPILYLQGSLNNVVVAVTDEGLSPVIWDGEKKLFSDEDHPCDSLGHEIFSPDRLKDVIHTIPKIHPDERNQ